MSDHDIATEHRNEDGEQRTTKRVEHDGDVFEFEGKPGGEYLYLGDSTLPAAVLEAVDDHLGEDEQLVDEAGDPFSLGTGTSSTTSSAEFSGASDEDVEAAVEGVDEDR